jgi:type II secretory pathway component HofQ
MKTAITTLLTAIAITLSASASPALLVETTITEQHPKGGKDVLAAPRITVESGKKATIRVGKLEYTVTPTLLDDGTIDLRAVLTEHNAKKADKLAEPRIIAKLGQIAEIQVGSFALATKTSLAK